jgi:hypothetical protein
MWGSKLRSSGAAVLLGILLSSCRTDEPIQRADFSAPGWHVQQGQAVWKPYYSRVELTGDLLLATNVNGDFFVQLTKNPFPVVTAQNVNGYWRIEFGAEESSWHGQHEPPARFAFFQLPGALLGGKIAGNWHFQSVTTNFWRLENRQSGEYLEGEFFP